MKWSKQIIIMLLCVFILTNLKCTTTKRAHKLPVEVQTTLNYTKPYFQIWNTAIKYKTRGANLYIPNLEIKANTQIENVYFRGMIGKLEKGRAIYTAILTNQKFNDGTPNPAIKQQEFPFDLLKNECVVSYTENGITKYYLIEGLIEKEGVYYPDGAPKSIN